MTKIIVYLSMILSVALSHAQNHNSNLLGGNYTCIEFTVTKENAYPTVFAAVTKADSINVDLSNIDKFVESVYSVCDFMPISNSSFYKGFELVYGKSEQTYNNCSLFISDFFNNFNHLHHKTNLILQTGEKVFIRYFDIMGIFLKEDETFIPNTKISIGLPKENMTMSVIIIPIAIVDYSNKIRLCFN